MLCNLCMYDLQPWRRRRVRLLLSEGSAVADVCALSYHRLNGTVPLGSRDSQPATWIPRTTVLVHPVDKRRNKRHRRPKPGSHCKSDAHGCTRHVTKAQVQLMIGHSGLFVVLAIALTFAVISLEIILLVCTRGLYETVKT